ncbi:hypothetical protein M0Q39_04870, partial [Patescibacteria group bacterium]|nr:hypothetical protein [Patescibacteria group bacterium]
MTNQYSIPGLNERLMQELLLNSKRQKQSPSDFTPSSQQMADYEYQKYKKVASPILQKTMIPSLMATLLAEPTYNKMLLKGVNKVAPSQAGKLSNFMDSAMGPLGGFGYLIPKVLSEGMKSKRLASERKYASQLGVVGKGSRILDNLSTLNYLISGLPRGLSMLGSGVIPGLNGVSKKIPRLEHYLTGTAGDVLSGGVSKAAKATGKHVTEEGTGFGIGPTGLSLGLAGLQVGMSIYKSIKIARLQPRREHPDSLGRKYYGPDTSGQAMTRILSMAGTGKIDPQTMSFMVLQVIEGDIRRSNLLLAGMRGEIASESDYRRQEKEKGSESFSTEYDSSILGKDDRGVVLRTLDVIENSLSSFKMKFDPITQLSAFAFGLLRGRIVLPKHETSKLAKIYGYDDEKKMMKEKSIGFGAMLDQTKLLHTSSSAIRNMAPSLETSQLAIASATFDINRYMLAELMTIRMSGFGIDQNVLYHKEPSFIREVLSNLGEKLNPLNLPGISAIVNVLGLASKTIFKTLPGIIPKIISGTGKVASTVKSFLFGEEYEELRSDHALLEKAGLNKDIKDIADSFIAKGLPGVLAELRHIQMTQLEVQQNILKTQMKMLDLQGGYYKYEELQRNKELLIWDNIDEKYITQDEAEKVKLSRINKLTSVKEEAFTKSFLGKMLLFSQLISPKKQIRKNVSTFSAGVGRMEGFESLIGSLESMFSGGRETFKSSDISKLLAGNLTSIRPRTGVEATSLEEEDIKRQTHFGDYLKFASGGLGMAALPLLGLLMSGGVGGGIGLLASLLLGGGATSRRFFQRRQIAKESKKQKGYATLDEEEFAKIGKDLNKSFIERSEDQQTSKFSAHFRPKSLEETYPYKTLVLLESIKDYLGTDSNNNVYSFLSSIAESTSIDQNKMVSLLESIQSSLKLPDISPLVVDQNKMVSLLESIQSSLKLPD